MKRDFYMRLHYIRPFRLRAWVVDLYDRWHAFFEVMGDAWWELRFKKHHHPKWTSPYGERECVCGFVYGDEDGYDHHMDRVREKEWDKRWSK
jgi:hypothetical protein